MCGMRDLVQRLERVVELVGPHLEAPGVGGDAGDLGAVQPVGGGERQARGGAAGVVAPAAALGDVAARVSRPVRTSSRSPRPTRADSPCAAIVASRCSAVMAKPSGSSPSVPIARPTSSSTPRPAISAGDGLDAGDQVALAGDDVAGTAAVPGVAVVEDVAEAVPLGGGLQRHGDDVVGAADAVREALVAALGVRAGVEHGVHRVGAPPPALLRAVRVEATGRARSCAPRRTSAGALAPLGVVEEVQRAEDVVGAPAAPVGAALRGRGDGALGVAAVERGWCRVHVSDGRRTPHGAQGRRDV